MSSAFLKRPGAAEVRARSTGFLGGVWVWFPVLIACVVIACESTGTMSAANTSVWWRPWWESLFGHLSDERWEVAHYLIRKTGHFFGYGVVCLTFVRGWLLVLAKKTNWSTKMWRFRAVLCGIGCTFLVASCDEIHQSFLPSRTALFTDVLLDTCGATIMCLLVWLVLWSGEKATSLIESPSR